MKTDLTPLSSVVLEFLRTMAQDLKRISYEESGEQKAETEQRIETLKELIKTIEES
jgi:hypothetical protein